MGVDRCREKKCLAAGTAGVSPACPALENIGERMMLTAMRTSFFLKFVAAEVCRRDAWVPAAIFSLYLISDTIHDHLMFSASSIAALTCFTVIERMHSGWSKATQVYIGHGLQAK